MKQCPKCKAQLPENARFCLYCMTSLEEKEHIQPPVERSYRWLLVLLCALLLGLLLVFLLRPASQTQPETPAETQPSASAGGETVEIIETTEAVPAVTTPVTTQPVQTQPVTPTQPGANTTPAQPGETTAPTQPEETTSSTQPPETTVPATTPATPTQPPETTEATEPTKPQPTLYSVTHEGVTYTCRKVVYGDIPGYTAPNDLLLLSVTTTRSDGVYAMPYGFSIPGNSNAEIRIVGENAFRGTNARVVILGSCVEYVKTGAFDGCNLRELHLNDSVNIPRAALSGCSSSMVIRSEEGAWDPVTNGRWKYQAVSYGFRWSDGAVPEEGPDSPLYTYRLATAGDNLGPNYQNDGKDIIITGLQRLGSYSRYEIPPSIDDLRVVGIDANAFAGSNVQTMYLATTIKTVKAYAFSGCALTDIYFRRNVNIDPAAFSGCPGGLTIHCPVDCSDLDQRNYSDNPELYGATWEEWNG